MASSRDDFVIAIRSAFLKKSYQQKFSLLTLLFLSLIILLLGSFNFKAIQILKSGLNEVVYRSSFIVSIPENYIKKINSQMNEHLDLYKRYKDNKVLLKDLQQKKLSSDFLVLENKRLRELINETVLSKDIYAKVLIDKESPYLKSIIINKGSRDQVKLGMAVLAGQYLAGKVIEVNFTNSRILLLSDLNSKVPALLEPLGVQAVLSGAGKNYGLIEYTKEKINDEITGKEIIVYTSGYGGLFKSGLPIGKITKSNKNEKNIVNFFSDFSQLDYVKIVSYLTESIN